MNAALNTCWQWRTVCSVSRSPSNTGTAGRRSSPSAVQSTWNVFGVVGIVPSSRTISSVPMLRTRPSRTMSSIRRSWSRSAVVIVEHRYIVGSTSSSSRRSSPARFEPVEQVGDRRRLGNASELVDERGRGRLEELAGLDQRPIEKPRVPRCDPGDVVRVDAVAQQEEARVGAGLARADDRVVVGGLGDRRECVDRAVAHAVGESYGRTLRGDGHVHVGGVDQLAAHADLGRLAAHRRREADHPAARRRAVLAGVGVGRASRVELVHREVASPVRSG